MVFGRKIGMGKVIRETSTELAIRLKQEGRWKAFCDRKADLEFEGKSKNHAHKLASREFGPKDKDAVIIAASDTSPGQPAVPGAEGLISVEGPKPAPKDLMPEPDEPVDAAVFAGKISDIRKDIEWVAENMDIGGLKPGMAPSATAWSFLKACREDAQMKADFYKTIWPKLLPSKSALEEQERFKDDGRKVLNILEKVEDASNRAVEKSFV